MILVHHQNTSTQQQKRGGVVGTVGAGFYKLTEKEGLKNGS